jgi:hypothetical protein
MRWLPVLARLVWLLRLIPLLALMRLLALVWLLGLMRLLALVWLLGLIGLLRRIRLARLSPARGRPCDRLGRGAVAGPVVIGTAMAGTGVACHGTTADRAELPARLYGMPTRCGVSKRRGVSGSSSVASRAVTHWAVTRTAVTRTAAIRSTARPAVSAHVHAPPAVHAQPPTPRYSRPSDSATIIRIFQAKTHTSDLFD